MEPAWSMWVCVWTITVTSSGATPASVSCASGRFSGPSRTTLPNAPSPSRAEAAAWSSAYSRGKPVSKSAHSPASVPTRNPGIPIRRGGRAAVTSKSP